MEAECSSQVDDFGAGRTPSPAGVAEAKMAAMNGSPVLIRDAALALRRLREEDLPRILSWREEPHVRAFWDNDDDSSGLGPALLDEHYRPLLDPTQPAIGAIIEVGGAPAGFLQMYPWAAEDADDVAAMSIPADPRAWGLDVFVGDPRFLGQGVGSRAVALACRYAFEAHDASCVALLAQRDNEVALRAYERAGFRRVREALDLDTRGGARIPCWLLVCERPPPLPL